MDEYKDTSTDISKGLRKIFPLWYEQEELFRRERNNFLVFAFFFILFFVIGYSCA